MESLTDPLLLNLIIDNNIPPTSFLRVAQNTLNNIHVHVVQLFTNPHINKTPVKFVFVSPERVLLY